VHDDGATVPIGGGQFVQRDGDPAASRGPLEMMVETAQSAAENSGAGPELLRAVDSIAVVNILARQYGNGPRLLAERIGAHRTEEVYTVLVGKRHSGW
jgi:acetyl-CoA C-acetyltransferase